MATENGIELVILTLIFSPDVNPAEPTITKTRGNRSVNNCVTEIQEWFQRITRKQRIRFPHDLSVKVCEWDITSGDELLFKVNDTPYEKILLVFGGELVYWVYYEDVLSGQRLEGFAPLPVDFCLCCLDTKCVQIIEAIQNSVLATLDRQLNK